MLWTIFAILLKPITLIGTGLTIFGAIALTYHGISYTTREKVLQMGPLQATQEVKKKTIGLPPILGGFALVGGIVLLVDKCLQLRYGVGQL